MFHPRLFQFQALLLVCTSFSYRGQKNNKNCHFLPWCFKVCSHFSTLSMLSNGPIIGGSNE